MRLLNVVVETPKGSRNKLSWNEDHKIYQLKGVLPAGMSFPFDFGFLPKTKGEDGDPLDILLLMDEPTYPGTWVPARLIGAIEASKPRTARPERMTRPLSHRGRLPRSRRTRVAWTDFHPRPPARIRAFLQSYNQAKANSSSILQRTGPDRGLPPFHNKAQR